MNVEKFQLEALEKYKAKNYTAALKILAKIHRLKPEYKNSYYLEAQIWNELGNTVKEYRALEKALPFLNFSTPAERDFSAEILSHVASLCFDLSLHEKSKEAFSLVVKLDDPPKVSRLDNALFHVNSQENVSPDYFRTFYDRYKKCLVDIKPYPKKFYAHKKIRVGFLSADFRQHPVINWSWSLLTGLDKNLFDTYLYSNVKNPDVVTEYLRKTAGTWRDIHALTDEVAAKLIRDDEIDILFDLSGHTDHNRLCVAAYRPASVQISGVGYMNSTGLECFDYFLSDIYCAGDESFFTEKVIRLPHSHVCYEPSIKFEPANSPPCLKNNFVTFGSFNQFGKVTDSMLSAWKEILDAVPASRLILKHKIFNTNDGKNFVVNKLKKFGFDVARVELRPYTANHLVEYGDVDIALDTFPYTGGVTTCEALYMGVPVVSLYGTRHGTRFGLSFLKNIGLDELAVDSYEKYIERAVGLAGDWELLTILRRNLRTMMRNSPLMDSANYLREIQAAFIKILNDERNANA
ncbi:MAG: hypothetical protein II857_06765 [Selenomonadaceae bacterium]|nr:hypothetical protein [Selenomonadaceae bacterium]